MTFNRVKLGHAVTFMKYRASIVSLIFLPKTLNLNRITFLASNWLNLSELVANELKEYLQKKLPLFLFLFLIYHCLMQRFQELITKELDNFTKILISIFCY